jgi:hypothetical protein
LVEFNIITSAAPFSSSDMHGCTSMHVLVIWEDLNWLGIRHGNEVVERPYAAAKKKTKIDKFISS